MEDKLKAKCDKMGENHDISTYQKIKQNDKEPLGTYRSYKYRWVILALYNLAMIISGIQWPMYSAIANVVVDYYGVSYEVSNWTGLVFLLGYVIGVYPGTCFIEKWGLRRAVIVGAVGSCVGAWIKIVSIKSDRFWVVILGQSCVAVTQVMLASIPAKLAATWFSAKQVSTACSIGSLGIQIGIAISYFTSTTMVQANPNKEVTEQSFYKLNLMYAGASSVVLLLIIVGFRDKPPVPPSHAQYVSNQSSTKVTKSVTRLFTNIPFVMFLVAYSFSIGTFFVICFLLNQMLISVYPDAGQDVGRMGTLFVVAGITGCVVFGTFLDRYHSFKKIAVLLFTVSTLTLSIFGLCINQGIPAQYIIIAMIGFFNNSVLPIGLEIAAEITFPESPSVSTGVLLISAKVSGMFLVYLQSFLLSNYQGIMPYLAMPVITLLSTIIVVLTRFDLKRQVVGSEVPVDSINNEC